MMCTIFAYAQLWLGSHAAGLIVFNLGAAIGIALTWYLQGRANLERRFENRFFRRRIYQLIGLFVILAAFLAGAAVEKVLEPLC
jgi:hypothetical protein